MKTCTKCKDPKLLGEFNKNKSRKDGYNNICRTCSNERSKQYYEENKDHHKIKIGERKKKVLTENKDKLLELLKSSSCKDCGNRDHRTFEFDHLSDKRKNVSELLAGACNWHTIETEIKKCEIVCANCHRIRSFSRSKTYRNN